MKSLRREKHQDYSKRRLPVPAHDRPGDGGDSRGSPRVVRDWQRTQTQSSSTTVISLRQPMDVRFCLMQEPSA